MLLRKTAFFLIALGCFAQILFAQSGPAEYFFGVRKAIYDKLPVSFSAQLTGKQIEKELEKIPKNAMLDGSKKPWVELIFQRDAGVSVKVKNVDEFYEDLFGDYVRFFTLGNILSNQSEQSLSAKYDFSYFMDSPGTKILALKLKPANSENKLHLYVDNTTKKIVRVDYLLGKDLITTTSIVYVAKKGKKDYLIPQKFLVKVFEGAQEKVLIFDLLNITFKE
ncbi:MAG: hypothetical protein A2Y33_07695 [Spirochaetes bacterium GWF1_51_8]|nr:MAG: hypothetical protein A2Y33_07695 [Spirochaetes bacterium GWF1_51_8]